MKNPFLQIGNFVNSKPVKMLEFRTRKDADNYMSANPNIYSLVCLIDGIETKLFASDVVELNTGNDLKDNWNK